MAGDIKPKLICIASAADVFAGDEIDRLQVRQFINMLARVASVADSGLILIGHPSLTGINSGSGLSGSTAWHNSVRSRMYLRNKPDSDARDLECHKNQYGAPTQTIEVEWHDGLFLEVDRHTRHANKQTQARHVFMILLKRFISENRPVSDLASHNYAPKKFVEEQEAKDANCTKADLEEAMRILLQCKQVVVEITGRASKQRRELRIAPQQEGAAQSTLDI